MGQNIFQGNGIVVLMLLRPIQTIRKVCWIVFKILDNGYLIYLLLYIDDMLVATRHMFDIDVMKRQLSARFEMKYLDATKKILGTTEKILGTEISQYRAAGVLHLSQNIYIEKTMVHFNINSSKFVSTCSALNSKLLDKLSLRTEREEKHMSGVPYSSFVGSITYTMASKSLDFTSKCC